MELSRYQYWILDTAIGPRPDTAADLAIHLADAEKYLSWLPVRSAFPPIEATTEEIAHEMRALFSSGYISWRQGHESPGKNIPSLDELIVAFREESRVYELTPLGGQVWEAYSNPNWDYFVFGIHRYLDRDTCFCEISCASQETLDRLLVSALIIPTEEVESAYYTQYPLMPDTVSRKSLRNWRAKYWKTLPHGFQYRFRVLTDHTQIRERACARSEPMTEAEKNSYFLPDYLQQNWYTKYFDPFKLTL